MTHTEEAKDLQAFGKRIAEIRKRRGLTQEELAYKLDISRLSVAFLETGRRWPRLTTLKRIAKALDIDLGEVFKNL